MSGGDTGIFSINPGDSKIFIAFWIPAKAGIQGIYVSSNPPQLIENLPIQNSKAWFHIKNSVLSPKLSPQHFLIKATLLLF